MKKSFKIILNSVTSVLLIVLGTVIGFRYSQTGILPFGVRPPTFASNYLDRVSLGVNSSEEEKKELDKLYEEWEKKAEEKDLNLDVFWEAWSNLEKLYLDEENIDETEMIRGATKGMVSSLGDPHTSYYAPKANERHSQDLEGSFGGVGIRLGYVDDTLAVMSPLKGTPADKAGVQPKDLIIHVRDEKKELDEDTVDWSLTDAVEKIRGPIGQPVYLTLFREGKEGENPFEVEIVRDEIVVESTELDFPEYQGEIYAEITLNRFGERTKQEWDEAVEQIQSRQDIKGIIIDLRSNPGGYLESAIELGSDFCKNCVIVTQKGKFSSQDYRSKGYNRLSSYPIVILVNGGSASASEILAGAIRDHIGAKLIGEKTFGKGTIQTRVELSDGSGMHITIGRWMLPNGDWIHHEGIPVDIEVEQDYETDEDEVLQKALQELNSY